MKFWNPTSLALLTLPLALTGCLDRYDYHGADPRAYNEQIYPKENRVEFNSIYQSFYFSADGQALMPDSEHALKEFASRIYPTSVERLVIASPYADDTRGRIMTRKLRSLGFKKKVMQYVVDDKLAPEEMVVQLDYNYVITPDCPDWRKSSDLNYSNTNMSQMRCAMVTNFGKQIANPKHLVESDELHVIPEPAVDAAAISNYRGDASNASGSNASASSDSGSSGDSGSSTTGTQ